MPKLEKKKAASVGQQETGQYTALPDGTYTGKLVKVEVKPGQVDDYWSWEFDLQDEGFTSRKLWVNTSLSDASEWKMKEVFDAFGYSTDSHTDEMVGELVTLVVTQRMIEKGARKGQMGNNVDQVLPYDGEASSNGSAAADEEDPF